MIYLPCIDSIYLPSSNLTSKQKRWRLDRDLLLADLEKDPKNTRTVFYLAQVKMRNSISCSPSIVLMILSMPINTMICVLKWEGGMRSGMKPSLGWQD